MNPEAKIALVTGAAPALAGPATIALLAEGWSVVLAGRRVDALEQTVVKAGSPGRRPDCANGRERSHSRGRVVPQDRETHGRLDLLFNNAGTGAPAIPIEDLTIEQWQQVVDVNLTGAFLCTQEAFRLMKDRRRGAGASSTTAPSRPMLRGPIPPPTRPPSTPSPASPNRPRWTGGSTTSPAARSTSATPTPT